MSKPRVSVLMGVYNGATYVARAVASVLAQSLTDFELIIINDGSTDGTARILRAFRDPRVRIVEHENRGLTSGLNEAASLASGRWLARQDADDISLVTRLERQVTFLEANPDIALIGSDVFMTNARGIFNEVFLYPESDQAIRQAFPILNPFCHGAVMLARTLFEQVGGYDTTFRFAQDYDLWSRLLPHCRAANVRVPLYGRVRHPGTTESTVAKDHIREAVLIRANARQNEHDRFELPAPSQYPIGTQDAYPIIATPAPEMRWLAVTYWRMACLLRKYSLPASTETALSFLYCPWWPLRPGN